MITADELRNQFGEIDEAVKKAYQLSELGEIFLKKGSVRGVTALKTTEAIRQEFLWDSLGGVWALPKEGRVLDIGTGGGIPGLVLAIMRPDLAFVLTDSASKKTNWVKEVAGTLVLDNVEIVTGRLEDLGRQKNMRNRFNAVTAKALAPLNLLLEFAIPFLRVKGRLLAYKGPAFASELEEARFAMSELSAELHRCHSYSIAEKEYRLCEFVKTGLTSERYPRDNGIPKKKPLLNSRKS